tara:strand:+ start:7269 stop:7886 length:618 start_codon:yes stop_codon:yes gene_type:complete
MKHTLSVSSDKFKNIPTKQGTDVVFEQVLISFLKRCAEDGLDLEQVTITVFDEVFTAEGDMPFDGTLSSFLSLLLDGVHLRRRLGSAMLDILMPATIMGYDLYDLIGDLENGRVPALVDHPEVEPEAALPVIRSRPEHRRRRATDYDDSVKPYIEGTVINGSEQDSRNHPRRRSTDAPPFDFGAVAGVKGKVSRTQPIRVTKTAS